MTREYVLTLLRRMEEMLLATLLAALILLSCTQIGLRLLFDSGMLWADPLLRHLVVWSGFLGAVLAVSRNKHISIDISQYLLPRRLFVILRIGIQLFSSAVCLVLTYASALFLHSEWEFGNGVLLLIPSWAWNLIFPVAFALMALRFFLGSLTPLSGLHHPAAAPRDTPE